VGPFEKAFSLSWMSKSAHVDELDKLVTGRLVSTLSAQGRTTQPPIVLRLLIRQLTRCVEAAYPFEVACDCGLVGELIFASGRGGIYKLTESEDPDERKVHEPLLALRNACFHPGNLGENPNVPGLVEALRKTDERGLADRLEKDWGLVSSSYDLARWAIQQANAVGRYELLALGRWWSPQGTR
jgi:hypothetical protein